MTYYLIIGTVIAIVIELLRDFYVKIPADMDERVFCFLFTVILWPVTLVSALVILTRGS